MIFYIQLFGGIALIVVGLFFIVMNWAVVLQWLLRRKHSSWVPLFGGLLAAIGTVVLPYPYFRSFWWVPLVIDWGSLPGLIFTVFYFGGRKIRNSEKEKRSGVEKEKGEGVKSLDAED